MPTTGTSPQPAPAPRRRALLRRRTVLLALAPFALTLAVLQLLVWEGRGGILDLVAGQLPPGPRIVHRDAPLRPPAGAPPFAVELALDRDVPPLARLPEEFLSFGLDASQLVGARWWEPTAARLEFGSGSVPTAAFDFERAGLDALVRPLAPAWLRIGGSESDRLLYDLGAGVAEDGRTVTAARWEALERFAGRNGLRVLFTLSVGPATRRDDGSWDPSAATALVRHALAGGTPIGAWELGNELNGFWAVHGPTEHVSPRQYAADLQAARAMLGREHPEALLVAQGSAWWPVVGEPLSILFPFTEPYLERAGGAMDVVGWHYYPQQSRRAPFASRRAHPARLLQPAALDEAAHWAGRVAELRDEHAPGRAVWLTETGNAQFGGEPGVSDSYLGALWWLDQLGLVARAGTEVVVRHTLCGMQYGLLDAATLAPRPDYWASLLWKQLMGPEVLAIEACGEHADRLRAYAHRDDAGTVSLLLLNLDPERACDVDMGDLGAAELFELATPDVMSGDLYLGGAPLTLTTHGGPPPLLGQRVNDLDTLRVNPLACTFVVLPPPTGRE